MPLLTASATFRHNSQECHRGTPKQPAFVRKRNAHEQREIPTGSMWVQRTHCASGLKLNHKKKRTPTHPAKVDVQSSCCKPPHMLMGEGLKCSSFLFTRHAMLGPAWVCCLRHDIFQRGRHCQLHWMGERSDASPTLGPTLRHNSERANHSRVHHSCSPLPKRRLISCRSSIDTDCSSSGPLQAKHPAAHMCL